MANWRSPQESPSSERTTTSNSPPGSRPRSSATAARSEGVGSAPGSAGGRWVTSEFERAGHPGPETRRARSRGRGPPLEPVDRDADGVRVGTARGRPGRVTYRGHGPAPPEVGRRGRPTSVPRALSRRCGPTAGGRCKGFGWARPTGSPAGPTDRSRRSSSVVGPARKGPGWPSGPGEAAPQRQTVDGAATRGWRRENW